MRRDDVHLHLGLTGVATIELIYLFDDSFDIGSRFLGWCENAKEERREEKGVCHQVACCYLYPILRFCHFPGILSTFIL